MVIKQATRVKGNIKVGADAIPDAVNLTGSGSTADGYIIFHEDVPLFLPKNTVEDLSTIVDSVLELLDLFVLSNGPMPPIGYPTNFIVNGTVLKADSSIKLLLLQKKLKQIKAELK